MLSKVSLSPVTLRLSLVACFLLSIKVITKETKTFFVFSGHADPNNRVSFCHTRTPVILMHDFCFPPEDMSPCQAEDCWVIN
jgi:hypothetical protein